MILLNDSIRHRPPRTTLVPSRSRNLCNDDILITAADFVFQFFFFFPSSPFSAFSHIVLCTFLIERCNFTDDEWRCLKYFVTKLLVREVIRILSHSLEESVAGNGPKPKVEERQFIFEFRAYSIVSSYRKINSIGSQCRMRCNQIIR